jgi:CubicO group peptidase (beta-lactamase class C family)
VTVLDAPTGLASAVRRLGDELDRWRVPGLEVAVVHDGEVLHAGGLGVRAAGSDAQVGADTLFHHGSCGKAYTSLLAVLLEEDGQLDLGAPVRNYVPELRLPDPVIADRVTTRDLLSHRSGLARHDLAWIFNPSWSREELVRRMEHLPLAGDLRAQWLYSNFGYTLAGLVIGRATGSTWEGQLWTRLLEPAGMSRSVLSVDAARTDADHAEPHLLRDDVAVATPWRHLEGTAPAGQVITSAADSARWLLLQLGAADLSASAVEKTHHLHMPIPPGLSPYPELRFLGYGMGWVVGTFRGRSMLWHSGGVDGFSTHVLLLPDDGIGVASSANLHGSQLPFAAVLDIADSLLAMPGERSWADRMHWTSAEATEAAQDDSASGNAPAPRRAETAFPTHSLGEYAGTFSHPGYGELVVTVTDGAITARLGEFDLEVKHRHYDTWDARYDVLEADMALTFRTDAGGTVADLAADFGDGSDSIVFLRRPVEDAAS